MPSRTSDRSFDPQTSLDALLAAKLAAIRSELLDEYRSPHGYPWVIGYSGGKDSSLVLHLVFELLLTLAPSERRRPVHIVANDTLVESPLVIRHIEKMFERFQLAIDAFDLPIKLDITRPAADNTFWVNLIGRGYPSPTRSFRWCTDRMKMLPTSQCIRSQASKAGRVILLLGVRRSESAARAARVDGYTRKGNGQRLNPHNDLAGCLVFRPIVDLDTDEVWELLGTLAPLEGRL